MKFDIEMIKGGLLVKLSGDIDLLIADELREKLAAVIKETAAKQVVFDFSKVTFIDSSGLGVILGRYRQLLPLGGKVSIIGANMQVYRILALSGLTKILQVEEPIKSRIARMKEGL